MEFSEKTPKQNSPGFHWSQRSPLPPPPSGRSRPLVPRAAPAPPAAAREEHRPRGPAPPHAHGQHGAARLPGPRGRPAAMSVMGPNQAPPAMVARAMGPERSPPGRKQGRARARSGSEGECAAVGPRRDNSAKGRAFPKLPAGLRWAAPQPLQALHNLGSSVSRPLPTAGPDRATDRPAAPGLRSLPEA